MGFMDNPKIIASQRRMNKILGIQTDLLQSNPELFPILNRNNDLLDTFRYYTAAINTLKEETKMYHINTEHGSTTSPDINFMKDIAQAEANRYKKEVVIYTITERIKPIEEKKKPEWIPALVRYQEIPEWWRMKEWKAQLMGEVILVKAVSKEEGDRFRAEYGQSKADFWSERNKNGGKWYWNLKDLILYPDAIEVETYASAKFAHKKGQKKTTKKYFKKDSSKDGWLI